MRIRSVCLAASLFLMIALSVAMIALQAPPAGQRGGRAPPQPGATARVGKGPGASQSRGANVAQANVADPYSGWRAGAGRAPSGPSAD